MKTSAEYVVAASYYKFLNRRPKRPSKEKKVKTPSQPWYEDNWTSIDEENAKKILDSHVEKCTISNILKSNESSAFEGNEDANAWDQFYCNHGSRFFKDRHYFEKAFPNEFLSSTAIQQPYTYARPSSRSNARFEERTLVEIGCGVGNAILPLLDMGKFERNWDVVHGLDISKEAIKILRDDPRFLAFNKTGPKTGKAYGHVCDVSKEFPPLCLGVSTVTTLIFCLSAIDPSKHEKAVQHAVESLRPGGVLVFRDYGRYDEAQMKLGTSRSKRIKDNFYRKHDGTKVYYFELNEVERMFCDNFRMQTLELKYLRRVYENKGTSEVRRRVWVQGRFRKSL